MSRQLVYYDSKWRDVQRKWVYQSDEWVEMFYDHVYADSKWNIGFLQNPAHMANITVEKKLITPIFNYYAYGYADEPNTIFGQFGQLTVQPSAILPPAPWRISAVYNYYKPSPGLWFHAFHIRAPLGTPNPGAGILRSIGYRDISGRSFGRNRLTFPWESYYYEADNEGEAWAYLTTPEKSEFEEEQWLRDNLPAFYEDTIGQVVPWGARLIL